MSILIQNNEITLQTFMHDKLEIHEKLQALEKTNFDLLLKLNQTKEEILQMLDAEVARNISSKLYESRHFVKKEELNEFFDDQIGNSLKDKVTKLDVNKLSDRINLLNKDLIKSSDHFHRLFNDLDDNLQRKLDLTFNTHWDSKFTKVSQVFRKIHKNMSSMNFKIEE